MRQKTEQRKIKMREYQAKWYSKNREKQLTANKLRRSEISLWLKNIKKDLHCIQCFENHSACLEFHHRDPKEKDANISQMLVQGFSKKKILEEISKCDVLCSNCHKKLHYAIG